MAEQDTKKRSALRIFLSYFRPHRGLFCLDMICALLIALIDLAFPLISRKAMYDWLPDKRYSVFFIVISPIRRRPVRPPSATWPATPRA